MDGILSRVLDSFERIERKWKSLYCRKFSKPLPFCCSYRILKMFLTDIGMLTHEMDV